MFASVQINIPYSPDTVSSWEMDVNDIGIGSNGYHSLRDEITRHIIILEMTNDTRWNNVLDTKSWSCTRTKYQPFQNPIQQSGPWRQNAVLHIP